MLKQRVITAVVLLIVLSAAMLAPVRWPLLVIFMLASSLASWEWLRLSLPAAQRFWAVPLAVLVALGLSALSLPFLSASAPEAGLTLRLIYHYLTPLVVLLWLLLAPYLVLQGQAQQLGQSFLLSFMGIAAPVVAWAALIQMWMTRGIFYVLTVLILIWVADIGAYFAGRAFGKRKLAPKVSPGKTWAGAIGGVLGATLWVALSTLWDNSFGADLLAAWSWLGLIVLAALLASLSIVGDLFESLLKRRAGFKDSSQLLPGHGGVYDRIDALLPVAPLAMILGGTYPLMW